MLASVFSHSNTSRYGDVIHCIPATIHPDRSAVARMLALVNLAPDIVTAVFNGITPETLTMANSPTVFPMTGRNSAKLLAWCKSRIQMAFEVAVWIFSITHHII